MIRLHGFPISNYYNKVKYFLLAKGLEFEEVRAAPGSDPEWRKISPMGKIPVLELDGFFIAESNVIVDYLEDKFPNPVLIGKTPEERAKTKELSHFLDLYVDLVARPLYGKAFQGIALTNLPADDTIVENSYVSAKKSVLALKNLLHFSPFLFGEKMSLADITGFVHLGLFRDTYTALGKENLFADWKEMEEYIAMLEGLEISKKINSARRAAIRARAVATRRQS